MTSDTAWFQAHTVYLATPDWQVRRKAVLLRDKWTCQAQLRMCTGRAEEVHHLTYRHWRNEPLFDLVSVCQACHVDLTRMDRQNRAIAPDGRLNWTERQQRKRPARATA